MGPFRMGEVMEFITLYSNQKKRIDEQIDDIKNLESLLDIVNNSKNYRVAFKNLNNCQINYETPSNVLDQGKKEIWEIDKEEKR